MAGLAPSPKAAQGAPHSVLADPSSPNDTKGADNAPFEQKMTAILPCNDLDAAQRFFERLGFALDDGSQDEYRRLSDGYGGHIHLGPAVEGWLVPGRNPFGLYLHREDVDALANKFASEILEPEGVSEKPWGMYEFSLNGPDETLVRVGWPCRLRRTAQEKK